MDEVFQADPAEATQAAISMGISAHNGIFALAAVLARNGLMQQGDVQFLHDSMLKPLTNDGASQQMMALQTERLDSLCAMLARAINERNGSTD